jgi:hypothetical protein
MSHQVFKVRQQAVPNALQEKIWILLLGMQNCCDANERNGAQC